VDTGSRQENASKQRREPPFRFQSEWKALETLTRRLPQRSFPELRQTLKPGTLCYNVLLPEPVQAGSRLLPRSRLSLNMAQVQTTKLATRRDDLTEGSDLQRTRLSWLRNVVQRTGAWLALLALVVQVASFFGHVHPRDFAGDIGSRTDLHKATVAPATVSNHGNLADDQDQCPICFSASLLATSFVPLAEQPAAVIRFGEAGYASVSAAFGPPESGRAPFQSRAPPSA
jgi:hypothetical protein